MRRTVLLLILVWIITGLLSCATYSQRKSSSDKIIDLVNTKNSVLLGEITKLPFLFDGEIIVLEKDSSMIWQNISNAGFSFEEIIDAESIPVSSKDYLLFGNTMEVKTWFEKYLPKKASLAKINCKNGLYYMILGPKKKVQTDASGAKKGYPAMCGFTGPVQEAK
ncbi:MAG: hypothetical protein FWF38_03455 [Spirochaetaceae bacterium]|nr:hypothetical protein [Spirochaetaceae bacterium]